MLDETVSALKLCVEQELSTVFESNSIFNSFGYLQLKIELLALIADASEFCTTTTCPSFVSMLTECVKKSIIHQYHVTMASAGAEEDRVKEFINYCDILYCDIANTDTFRQVF